MDTIFSKFLLGVHLPQKNYLYKNNVPKFFLKNDEI
jgi:hypothetical protein